MSVEDSSGRSSSKATSPETGFFVLYRVMKNKTV